MTVTTQAAGGGEARPRPRPFARLFGRRSGLDDGARPLSAVLIVLLVVLVLPPIGILIYRSLIHVNAAGATTGFTFDHFRELLSAGDFFSVAWTSIIFAGMTTLVSLIFGGSIAWIVERTDAPFKRLAYFTTIISLGTPYILYITAWLYILGRNGPINSIYRSITGSFGALFDVFSLWGMVLIEGFLWSPLVFLLLSATFRAANAEMEEAARMNGATVWQTIRLVSIKLAWPAVLALALFVFIRNLEVFEVPALVGVPGNIRVFTTDIYYSVKQVPPALGHASAFSVVLLVIVAVLLYFYSRVARNAERFASITGKGYRPRPFRLGRWRWAGGAVILFNFAIVLGLPLAALVWTSLLPFAGPVSARVAAQVSFDNYVKVFSSPYYLEYAINTILVAGAAATAVMLVALIGGWLAARRKPGGAVIDQMAMMPLIFPGIVLGVAMIQIALRVPLPLYGSLSLLVIAFFVRYIPYGMRYAYSGVLQIHRELEEAAAVSGAPTAGRLRRVVAPLLAPALLSGWLFVFLIAAKELSIAILLAGPKSQMMAVVMYDMWVNGQSTELSALGLIWTTLMVVIAALFYFLGRDRSSTGFGH